MPDKEPIDDTPIVDITKIKFKFGHCSRCSSTNLSIIHKEQVVCNDCGDWIWLEDAVNSCWNGYCEPS
jgi:ribosomal protein S27AE